MMGQEGMLEDQDGDREGTTAAGVVKQDTAGTKGGTRESQSGNSSRMWLGSRSTSYLESC